MSEALRLDVSPPAATLLIDRPNQKNAFTAAMWKAVSGLIERASAHAGVRCVVLTSAVDGVFAAGADLAEFETFRTDEAARAANQRAIRDAARAVEACPVPVIAAIDGPCMGGGFILAGAADMRLAGQRAVFGFPPGKLGLLYQYEDLVRLIDLVGPGRAKWLLLTARRIDAPTALRVGLVDEVAEREDMGSALSGLVDDIAALSSESVRRMKRQVDKAVSGQRTETAALVAEFLDMHASADHGEGLAAFREKRRPNFS